MSTYTLLVDYSMDVDSSFISNVSYNKDNRTLFVTIGDKIYEYTDRDETDYLKMVTAESAGRAWRDVVGPHGHSDDWWETSNTSFELATKEDIALDEEGVKENPESEEWPLRSEVINLNNNHYLALNLAIDWAKSLSPNSYADWQDVVAAAKEFKEFLDADS